MAYKILKSMIELGYEPNVVTWTTILHGLCQQNAMSDAMHLVETMSARSDAKPNVVTFTTLVRGWCIIKQKRRTRSQSHTQYRAKKFLRDCWTFNYFKIRF